MSLDINGTANATMSKFLLASSVSNLTYLLADGILGLSPQFINGNASGGELFINRLVAQNVTSSAVFSISLGRTNESSKLHLGGYSPQYVFKKYSNS